MARRLREAHRPRDGRREHERPEVAPQLPFDLSGETRASVGHREENPRNRERRVQLRLDEVDGAEQLRQALERVVLGLNRHDRTVRGSERVHRQRTEGRRAVEQDVGVRIELAGESLGEVALTAGPVREVDGRGGETALRHHDVEVVDARGLRQTRKRDAVEQVVRRRAVRPQPQPRGRIRLRIEVDEEDVLARRGETRAQVHGGRRLPDATLLVRNGVDPCRRNESGAPLSRTLRWRANP